MLYSDWINAVCTIFELPIADAASAAPSTDANFNLIYPRAIEYAEGRLYKDIDTLNSVKTITTGSLTANQRSFTLPLSGAITFRAVQEVIPVVGGIKQTPLLPISRQALDYMFPAEAAIAGQSVPLYWCPVDQLSILVAPSASAITPVHIVGTMAFAPMTSIVTFNFLSMEFPDLYLAASCIFLCGYQRDFGAQSDDPQIASSWEAQYQNLLKPALAEEARKKLKALGIEPVAPPVKAAA